MPAPTASRESDERLLAWVRMRSRGLSVREIGQRFDVSGNLVHMLTSAVLFDDIHCSGEPEADVRKAYW